MAWLGLAWGAGFFGSAAFAVVALTFLFRWMDGEYESQVDYVAWPHFTVLNSTMRLVSDQEHDNGVYISGELELESTPPSDFVSISATLRDSNGVFVDVCEKEYLLTAEFTRPFKVHCREVYDLDHFADYEISVHALVR